MKLNNLIKSNHWLSIELTLLQLYPDQHEMIEEYRNVFNILQMLEPEDNDMNIVLTEYDCDPNFESDKTTYIDVSGRKNTVDPNWLTESYAIEFVAWSKWLGMELAPETIKNFSELEIIAHCLYEMTFVGYEEDEIQEKLKSIEKTAEEFKNMTDEEKKKQTIPLDELIKRLDDKKGKN